jgi:hypothetical protein
MFISRINSLLSKISARQKRDFGKFRRKYLFLLKMVEFDIWDFKLRKIKKYIYRDLGE